RQALPATPTGADRDELFAIVRDQWNSLAHVGLGARILESGDALGAETLHALLTRKSDDRSFDDARMHWILALIDAGRREEAAALIEALNLPRGGQRMPDKSPESLFDGRVFATQGADEAEFLRDIVAGHSDGDPFDRFIGDGQQGLLWSSG